MTLTPPPEQFEEAQDCRGGLEGVLVATNFWPACGNCLHKAECWESMAPRHPAFPHTWEWFHDSRIFPEGQDGGTSLALVVRSWVGISVYGEKHTSCYSYQVNPRYTVSVNTMRKYARVLRMARRVRELERRIAFVEKQYPDLSMPLAEEQQWKSDTDELDALERDIRALENLPKGVDVNDRIR